MYSAQAKLDGFLTQIGCINQNISVVRLIHFWTEQLFSSSVVWAEVGEEDEVSQRDSNLWSRIRKLFCEAPVGFFITPADIFLREWLFFYGYSVMQWAMIDEKKLKKYRVKIWTNTSYGLHNYIQNVATLHVTTYES